MPNLPGNIDNLAGAASTRAPDYWNFSRWRLRPTTSRTTGRSSPAAGQFKANLCCGGTPPTPVARSRAADRYGMSIAADSVWVMSTEDDPQPARRLLQHDRRVLQSVARPGQRLTGPSRATAAVSDWYTLALQPWRLHLLPRRSTSPRFWAPAPPDDQPPGSARAASGIQHPDAWTAACAPEPLPRARHSMKGRRGTARATTARRRASSPINLVFNSALTAHMAPSSPDAS